MFRSACSRVDRSRVTNLLQRTHNLTLAQQEVIIMIKVSLFSYVHATVNDFWKFIQARICLCCFGAMLPGKVWIYLPALRVASVASFMSNIDPMSASYRCQVKRWMSNYLSVYLSACLSINLLWRNIKHIFNWRTADWRLNLAESVSKISHVLWS